MNTNKNLTKDGKFQKDKKILNLVGSDDSKTTHNDL